MMEWRYWSERGFCFWSYMYFVTRTSEHYNCFVKKMMKKKQKRVNYSQFYYLLVIAVQACTCKGTVINLKHFIWVQCYVWIVGMNSLLTGITRDGRVIIQDLKTTRATGKRIWSWIQHNLSRNCHK